MGGHCRGLRTKLRAALWPGFLLLLASLQGCGVTNPPASTAASAPDPKSGKFLLVKEEKAYFEQPDGSIVGVPLEKLTPLERRAVEGTTTPPPQSPAAASSIASTVATNPSQPAVDKPVFVEVAPERTQPTAEAAPVATETTPTPAFTEFAPTADSVALIEEVQKVFQTKCHRCHGDRGANEGGFNYVMNLAKLKESYVVAGAPERSRLFHRISDTKSDSVMPPAGEEPRMTAGEIETVKRWIATGAASPKGEMRRFIRNDEIMKLVMGDLAQLPERTRRFHRYATLTNIYNSGATADELATYRLAFVKLINSLSWNANLFVPPMVDKDETILRIDLRALNWTDENWEQVVAANPYAVPVDTAEAAKCSDETETTMPVVRVDWFVFAASKPPLYHKILGIPETDSELENLLRINVSSNIDQEKVVRAGFNRSGVSRNNRMIERHESPYGSYWKSYDFSGNSGKQNLFAYPLGPKGRNAFEHAGGEIIFTLPNGLLGFMLTDHTGRRIDKGPTEIVSDMQRGDRAVINGISCMSCHYGGPIPKVDEVRSVVLANRKAFDESDRILAMYSGQDALNKEFDKDSRKFLDSLEKLEIRKVSKAGEPVSSMSLRFEGELDCRMAAAELGLTGPELMERLPTTSTVGRTLGSLNLKGGMIKRDTFVEVFRQCLDELGLRGKGSSGKAIAANKPGSVRPQPNLRRMVKIAVKDENTVGEIRRFPSLERIGAAGAITFSPDGGWLAVGTSDKKILLLDVNTSKQIESVEKIDAVGRISAVAFSPTADSLVAGGDKGVIGFYKVDPRGQLSPKGALAGHTRGITFLGFSPDGRRIISGSSDNTLRCWDAKSMKQEFQVGFERDVKNCVFPDDGRTVAATDGRSFKRIELVTGNIESTHGAGKGFGQFAVIQPNAKRIVTNEGWGLTIFDPVAGAAVGDIGGSSASRGESFWSGTFSPDGERFFTGGMGSVTLWDLTTKERIVSYPTSESTFTKLIAFSPDNQHVAAGADHDRTIIVFRMPKK